jgi:pimeloyl-ACP methyl ester carboxylesterase
MHYAETPGLEPTLVLIHSSGLDHRQWGALRLAMKRDSRVLALDLYGSGKNAPWTAGTPFSMDDDVEVVLSVMDQVDGEVVLVGHSYGGYLALSAALRAPERARAVLVHEPVIWGVLHDVGDPEIIAQIERANEDGRFLSRELGGKEAWWRRFIDIWGGEGAWDRLAEERRKAFLAVGPKVFEEVSALFLDRTPRRRWAEIHVPVVITVGNGTQPLEDRACQAVAAVMEDVRLVRIEGGHMAPLVEPQAFAAVLEELLVRLDAEATPSRRG